MSKPSLVIVLVEDNCHKMLLYRYLVKRGLDRHLIRIQQSPSGAGSAENWVRREFVREVSEYRSRQAKTELIVVIDADTGTVHDRLQQLDQALLDGGKQAVDTDAERIARLVPKRNIETWILCLNGQRVDEAMDYKQARNNWSELIAPAAETLLQWTRPNAGLPDDCVDSLRRGIVELNRLK